ncbi:MAG: glycosyltransferase family 2 protein, partial [Candidatus Nanoperiomorbaceae bacterium]
MQIVVLIPAHNEQDDIAATIEALLNQGRLADRVVVIANGCHDETATIARRYPVTVLEFPMLQHRKSEALNIGWEIYGEEADLVICLDADTVLPPNAIKDWEQEFLFDEQQSTRHATNNRRLGGSSSKFTMPGKGFLTRLQRAEFAKWTDTSLARGYTTVLAGTGCAISGQALREVVRTTGRSGPWSYYSQVEDFELTYQIRKLGYFCRVSTTVRAYTDSMKTVRSLWSQRMKWQVGTVEDLLHIGVNRLTMIDWWQQACGFFMAALRVLWAAVLIGLTAFHELQFTWLWIVVVPLLFVATELYSALRIPNRDRLD